MQKIFFLVVAILLSKATIAQPLDTIRRKDAGNIEFLQVRKGVLVLAEGYRHNGVAEGTWINYWETGFPYLITNYRNNLRNGVAMQCNSQGFIELIENYKDDLLDGPKRIYQIGTGLVSEETYYSDGKMHGSYIKRYANGKTQEISNYNKNVRDGKATWFYETGEKAAEYTYTNGKLQGEVANYHQNGKVSDAGRYENDEQTGYWREFYDNGLLKAEGNYTKGKKEGNWKEYDTAGHFVKTIKYEKGNQK